jgi:hypothetical protein
LAGGSAWYWTVWEFLDEASKDEARTEIHDAASTVLKEI